MLFDLQPKTRKEDLYDRERELEAFNEALKLGERLVLILGIRRLGKSSLLNVVLSESSYPYAKIDVRSLYFTHGSIPQEILAKRILSSLIESLPPSGKLRLGMTEALSSIRGIRLSGVHVEFEKKPDLAEILEKVDSWAESEGKRVIIAFDEAQYLRLSGIQYDGLIAYAVDNLPNLTFVLTGSEVGMLHDFLGLDNPKKPLFGRYAREITLERFSRERSIEFLKAGFKELGIDVSPSELERAVDKLDGIVGWLSMYGYLRGIRKLPERDALNEVFHRAQALVLEELSSLLSHSRRYGLILKAVAMGNERWSDIKEYLEFKAGRINDSKFSSLLKNLVKYGYLNKSADGYVIPDPVVEEVIKGLQLTPG
ncbi:ATP-binding protein [Thermococcus sp. 18S1]|uniref:AAA family ATPase n=1 Tax=Thermococcus sp. 18S1 TaxID=1638210 RepID=UPI00143B3441|nr:ATP-binding protein [Thermococcus sp. 18S1]NJE29764.1 ATP-binding protein [Thermococcus sp. 18S1]